jgi:hypothetical protein
MLVADKSNLMLDRRLHTHYCSNSSSKHWPMVRSVLDSTHSDCIDHKCLGCFGYKPSCSGLTVVDSLLLSTKHILWLASCSYFPTQ